MSTQISRKDFTDIEITTALVKSKNVIAKAARELTKLDKGVVSAQLLRYWVSKLDKSELPDYFDRAKEVASKRTVSVENAKLRKDVNALVEALGTKDDLIDALGGAAELLNTRPALPDAYPTNPTGIPLTVEILLSDLQIGKLAPGYNTAIANARLTEFAEAAIFQILKKINEGYFVEKIMLAILGDIIESDKKHVNSARGTDTGTANQLMDAFIGLFHRVIEPLAKLSIPIEVVCVTGNHDHDGHGLMSFNPGKEHLSYPLYMGLKLLTETAGYRHISFVIPEGSFAVAEIYGQLVLYEHGVGVAANETAMKTHKIKRSEQIKQYITYFRMGDKHNVITFNANQYVINGSFFGTDAEGAEYSSIAGYSSIPSQWIGFHVPRSDNRFTIYDSFTIQLGHVF